MMKKIFFTFCSVLLLSVSAFATPGFVNFKVNPSNPAANERTFVFMNVDTEATDAQGLEPVLNATVDGNFENISNPTRGLWIFLSSTLMSGTHTVDAQYFVRNKNVADGYRAQINQITAEIYDLQGRIDVEDDAVQKQILIDQKTLKETALNQLNTSLESMKTLVSTESFSFEVL